MLYYYIETIKSTYRALQASLINNIQNIQSIAGNQLHAIIQIHIVRTKNTDLIQTIELKGHH